MKKLVLYIHGKGGCAGESEHYKPLFPECDVVGLDYQTFKVEEIDDPMTKKMRQLDKLIDELATEKPMEKVLR